jgi:hypothetical protein
MALFGSTLAGGGLSEGGVYALSAEIDGSVPSKFAPSGVAAEASGPLVLGTVSNPVFVYGNGSKLMRVPYVPGSSGGFTSASAKEVDASGLVSTPPLAGAEGRMYVVDSAGTVSAYSSDVVELQWRLASGPGGISGMVDGPLNIDVARKPNGEKDCSKPGTLYA